MKVETYLFDPRPQYPFVLTANRYPNPHLNIDDGATLIFTHGTGFHKEQWEPTIEHLYEIEYGKNTSFKIREAWSIECPNHGDSAILNEKRLLAGCYDQVFGWEEYARIVHAMLMGLGRLKLQQNGNEHEVNINFTQRNLVAVGHSMGAVALILTQTFHPAINFHSIILVEPMLIVHEHRLKFGEVIDLAGGAALRRDIWPSKEKAYESFSSRPSWKTWDERILRIYVESGLREISSTDPEGRTGVTLKCTKVQEAACYSDSVGRTRAYDFLADLCASPTEVHLIWGGVDDYIPRGIKDDVENVAALGKLTSVGRVPGIGHLGPQVSPRKIAEAVWATFVDPGGRSKL